MIRTAIACLLVPQMAVAQVDLEKVVRRSFLEGTTEFLPLAQADAKAAISHLTTVENRGPTKLDRCSASYALSFLTHPSMRHVSRMLAHKGHDGYTYLDEAMPDALYRLFVTNRNVGVLERILVLNYDGAVGETLSVNVAELFLKFPNTFARAILNLKGHDGARRWLEQEPNASLVLWALVGHLDNPVELTKLHSRLSASPAREAKLAAATVDYVLRHGGQWR